MSHKLTPITNPNKNPPGIIKMRNKNKKRKGRMKKDVRALARFHTKRVIAL